jgi:hypothetical protein
VDAAGVSWTVKLGEEARSDVVTPRLAWALGYCAIESYFVAAGRIEGIDKATDLGRAKGWILEDGTMRGGARFKRRDDREIQSPDGEDIHWELKTNPGVPPEHLNGLRLFNVLVNNWDVGPKNCKILRIAGANGPENWFYISDLGASLAGGRWGKFKHKEFTNDRTLVKSVDGDHMIFDFRSALTAQSQQDVHRRVPIAHVRWFVTQFEKLPEKGLRAAFDAAFATEELNRAYAKGDLDEIERVREREISHHQRAEIAAFVAKLRERVAEMKSRLPSA